MWAVTGGDLSVEEIGDLEHEAVAEIGNIILNACVATLANELRRNFGMSLPEVLRGDANELLRTTVPDETTAAVLFVYIDFTTKRRNIRGYLALVIDLASLATLQTLPAEFIARLS